MVGDSQIYGRSLIQFGKGQTPSQSVATGPNLPFVAPGHFNQVGESIYNETGIARRKPDPDD